MGIPGLPFSRDFRDPVVIIRTPSACKRGDRDDAYDAGGYSHMQILKHISSKMAKSEVANVCSRDPIPQEMESLNEKLKMEEEHRSDSGGR